MWDYCHYRLTFYLLVVINDVLHGKIIAIVNVIIGLQLLATVLYYRGVMPASSYFEPRLL